ncbi:MAG: hypothetical protein A2Z28_07390 [Chloroflexi bacterium RBG_16_51_9]|nr:MAG: hypothetical protein A2Z28_07390 [Chloroflexi bacterium RBG_16_51_9]
MKPDLPFQANCGTTAMGIMPHRDIERALKLTLSLDIPFWPQLPHVSFYEDMYAQFSQHFPGIIVDEENKKLYFDSSRFEEEMGDYSQKMSDPKTFALSKQYSVVYHRFLKETLSDYLAIRGQLIGPVSFGFRVMDENNRPIIYNEDVKTILFDFIKQKINAQYRELREKNKNAFVWLDEPGLSWIFSGLSGYSDVQAKSDYQSFFSGLESIRALHLCANVNLPYLLEMGTDLLSFDAYQMSLMPKGYAASVAKFIDSGGIICWGIVPTDSDNLSKQTPQSLADLIIEYWKVVAENTGLPLKQLAEQALIAPARCCLKNIGQVGASDDAKPGKIGHVDLSVEELLVEKAFGYLNVISEILRKDFSLRP